jgi:hypothetical protein
MLEGSPYIECDAGESLNCSDSVHPDHFMGDEHWHFNNTGYCKRGNGQTPTHSYTPACCTHKQILIEWQKWWLQTRPLGLVVGIS